MKKFTLLYKNQNFNFCIINNNFLKYNYTSLKVFS